MKFSYTAINKDGQKYTGNLEAQTKADFYTEFKKIGDTLVTVKEQSGKKLSINSNITFFERIKKTTIKINVARIQVSCFL